MRKIRWQSVVRAVVVTLGLSTGTVWAAGPWPFTEEWYRQRADDPPGARQIEKDGKYWPPYPRPIGRKQTFSHAFHTAHYWPHPYNCQDRGDYHSLLAAQTGAGWELATTLHDYHFDGDTQQLTDAGRSQLAYILNSVPAQYRTVYVSQGVTQEMGALRAANAEKFLRESGSPSIPPVITKVETFAGRPANEIDRLRQLELYSIPRPRLFLIGVAARMGASGGGGGGGAMGGMGGAGGGIGGGSGGESGFVDQQVVNDTVCGG
jgi:hypothetical protein